MASEGCRTWGQELRKSSGSPLKMGILLSAPVWKMETEVTRLSDLIHAAWKAEPCRDPSFFSVLLSGCSSHQKVAIRGGACGNLEALALQNCLEVKCMDPHAH